MEEAREAKDYAAEKAEGAAKEAAAATAASALGYGSDKTAGASYSLQEKREAAQEKGMTGTAKALYKAEDAAADTSQYLAEKADKLRVSAGEYGDTEESGRSKVLSGKGGEEGEERRAGGPHFTLSGSSRFRCSYPLCFASGRSCFSACASWFLGPSPPCSDDLVAHTLRLPSASFPPCLFRPLQELHNNWDQAKGAAVDAAREAQHDAQKLFSGGGESAHPGSPVDWIKEKVGRF